MWVFLDDSGDSGHKFEKGSTKFVVISACIFKSPESITQAQELISDARTQRAPDGSVYRVEREFKYSSTRRAHKDAFFEALKPADFVIKTIYVNKQRLYSKKFLEDPNSLKSYLIQALITSPFSPLVNAKLVIDGQDTRAFNMPDRDYFLNKVAQLSPGAVTSVEWADSKENALIQLADMVAGATRKKLEDLCPVATGHFQTFAARAYQRVGGTYWHFTRRT